MSGGGVLSIHKPSIGSAVGTAVVGSAVCSLDGRLVDGGVDGAFVAGAVDTGFVVVTVVDDAFVAGEADC
jgi:hypothetical protein